MIPPNTLTAARLVAIRNSVLGALGADYDRLQAPIEKWVASTARAMKQPALVAAADLARDFSETGDQDMAQRTLAAGVELSETFRGTVQ